MRSAISRWRWKNGNRVRPRCTTRLNTLIRLVYRGLTLQTYTVYTVARPKTDSAVLTLRVPARVNRYLTREARRRRQTRSEVARAILQERVEGAGVSDDLAEARRQSLLVSKRRSERDTLTFLEAVADRRGWK